MMKSSPRSTYPLVESIGCWNGNCPFLSYHQQRLERSIKKLYPSGKIHDLNSILSNVELPKGKHKIRFLYNDKNYDLDILPYPIKVIERLQIVKSNEISYPFKYTERPELDGLFERKGKADEILIFKKGLLTDAYYANTVCIYQGQLISPKIPLLNGVMRAFLLDTGQVKLMDIDMKTLRESEGVFLINALNPVTTAPFISIENIYS